MRNRKDFKKLILNIEKKFPVNSWNFSNITLWPMLRNRLYFKLIYKYESFHQLILNDKQDDHVIKMDKPKEVNPLSWWSTIRKLKEKSFLFFSPTHIRVFHDDKMFNRFFDSFIHNKTLQKKSYVLDYQGKIKDGLSPSNEKIYFDLDSIIRSYRKYYRIKNRLIPKVETDNIELDQYDDYLNYLKRELNDTHFTKEFERTQLIEYCQSIIVNAKLMTNILRTVKPELIYIICYYNPWMYALQIAAYELNIPVIEFQHGPMSDTHLAYANWNCIPESGYQLVPDEFYCWDEISKEIVEDWALKTSKHKVFLAGNPWINFIKESSINHNIDSNFILYTLQPFAFGKLFPNELIKFIKDHDYKWYLRIHPRQLAQKSELENFLKTKGIFKLVDIDDSTNLPLPVLLENCWFHTTNSSGSTIEASMLGKKTVILDEIGKDYYEAQIKNEMATFVPIDVNFNEKFKEAIDSIDKMTAKS